MAPDARWSHAGSELSAPGATLEMRLGPVCFYSPISRALVHGCVIIFRVRFPRVQTTSGGPLKRAGENRPCCPAWAIARRPDGIDFIENYKLSSFPQNPFISIIIPRPATVTMKTTGNNVSVFRFAFSFETTRRPRRAPPRRRRRPLGSPQLLGRPESHVRSNW